MEYKISFILRKGAVLIIILKESFFLPYVVVNRLYVLLAEFKKVLEDIMSSIVTQGYVVWLTIINPFHLIKIPPSVGIPPIFPSSGKTRIPLHSILIPCWSTFPACQRLLIRIPNSFRLFSEFTSTRISVQVINLIN